MKTVNWCSTNGLHGSTLQNHHCPPSLVSPTVEPEIWLHKNLKFHCGLLRFAHSARKVPATDCDIKSLRHDLASLTRKVLFPFPCELFCSYFREKKFTLLQTIEKPVRSCGRYVSHPSISRIVIPLPCYAANFFVDSARSHPPRTIFYQKPNRYTILSFDTSGGNHPSRFLTINSSTSGCKQPYIERTADVTKSQHFQ